MKLKKEEELMLKDLILENVSITGLPQIRVKEGETPPEVHLTLSLLPIIEYIEGIMSVQEEKTKTKSKHFIKKLLDKQRLSKTFTLIRAAISRIPEIYK